MQQLAALLSASPAETFDQLPGFKDHQDDVTVTYNAPSTGRHHGCTQHSSFSIDDILSSSPQRRNHGDEHQHQQPDEHHRRYQITAESLITYHNNTSLPALPLTHAFYGQCLDIVLFRRRNRYSPIIYNFFKIFYLSYNKNKTRFRYFYCKSHRFKTANVKISVILCAQNLPIKFGYYAVLKRGFHNKINFCCVIR